MALFSNERTIFAFMYRVLVFGFLFTISCLLGNAQNNAPFVVNYSNLHGFPPLKISKMTIDSSGFLWIGSNLGLHRFDGTNFKTYTSIPKTIISDLQIDERGNIYVALLGEGIAIYNEFKEEFEIKSLEDVFKNNVGQHISLLLIGAKKKLVSHNGVGIFRIDLEKNTSELLLEKKDIYKLLAHPLDSNKVILIADFLYSLNMSNGNLDVLSERYVYDAEVDSKNQLWYTSEEVIGISKIDLKNFSEADHLLRNSTLSIGDLFKIKDQEIWMESSHGLLRYDIENSLWENYFEEDKSTLGVFVDKRGRIWFGQDNKVKLIDPENQHFLMIEGSENYTYTTVCQISENEFLFVPFNEPEFHIFNLEKRSFNKQKLPPAFQFLEYPFGAVKIDSDIYISYNNGIALYHPPTQKLEVLDFGKYENALYSNHKKDIFKDKDNLLYISSMTENMLFRYNPESKEIDSINYEVPQEEYRQRLQVLEDGQILVPTETGLIEIDFDTGGQTFKPFMKGQDTVNLGFIDALSKDENHIWMLGRGFIIKCQKINGHIAIINEYKNEKLLNYNLGLDFLKYSDRETAILTSSGVILINEADQFLSYGVNEGLVNVDRRMRANVFGDLVFFMSNGVSYSDFSKIEHYPYKPSVQISRFDVNGENIIGLTDISLAPSKNSIKISFHSIDLSKPKDVKYRYRLSEHSSWIYADYNDHEVYLLDLKSGEYNFEVSAKHKYTDWSAPAKVHFEIELPFWRTAWFAILSLLTVILISYLFYRGKLKRAGELSKMRTRMAQLENEALRAQMNPHFIFNSLNSIKSYIIDHKKEEAADYLTNFSDLIRQILSNSRAQLIPLSKELEASKLYMDIENIRLEDKFTYEINNEVSDAMIQPLTLQPFIENAIWHGFIHKKGFGHLKIDISKDNSDLLISIDDDGVGRQKSGEIEKKHSRKRSFGIVITKERLAQSNQGNNMEIIDKPNHRGTIVKIRIPYITTHQTNKDEK